MTVAALSLPRAACGAANDEAANEAVPAGSFSLLQTDSFEIPYGEYSHSAGMQVFDRESAQMMANEMASLMGRLTRGFRGIPVYAGHPDHPDGPTRAQYPDRRARGWIKEIIVGESSAKFVVAYNELGRGEVEDAQWAGYSPLWLLKPIVAANGKPGLRYRPAILKSIALTNNPNIPVPPLIAANEPGASPPAESPPENTNAMNLKPEILAKLMKLLSMTEQPDEETLNTRLGTYCDERMTDAENGGKPKPEIANEAIVRMQNDVTAAVTAANESAAALRETRIDFALDSLISSGRLTPADRDAASTRLRAIANESELTTEINKLRSAAPRLQTERQVSQGLPGMRPEMLAANENHQRREGRDAAVQQVMKEHPGMTRTMAWGIAASRNPDLFAA